LNGYRLFYLFLFALLGTPAFAYLDPGTGSMLLYAIAGMATTVFFLFKNLWYALRGKVFLRGGVAVSSGLPDLVFFSEGGKYWQVFKSTIQALEREGASCAYVTSDPADPGLTHVGAGYRAINPGKETATIAWMNAVTAGTVVATTPHLDVYMWRRSKRVKRYVHLFHAPTDIVFYEKYAFDWYDTLLTVGPFQEKSVRELEEKRGTPVKELLPTGCTYFDYMIEEVAKLPQRRESGPSVLYAPAWGVRSSTVTHGSKIIETLADAGFHVIFRPHPQFYVSHLSLITDIEKRFALSTQVEIDRNRTGIASMARSDLMVTDLSGVLFDYACLFGRPILLANAKADAGGQEGEDLTGPLWDVEASIDLSYTLIADDLGGLADQARAALSDGGGYADKIARFRGDTLYNFGHAGEAAARNLLSLYQDSK
jgi:hypothetical protein